MRVAADQMLRLLGLTFRANLSCWMTWPVVTRVLNRDSRSRGHRQVEERDAGYTSSIHPEAV